MLVEVSCSKGNVCTVCLCHDEKEIAQAVFNLAELIDIPLSTRFAALPFIALFLINPERGPFEFEGISLRHLSEEEEDKWQKAF
jgi:hypothetical protein